MRIIIFLFSAFISVLFLTGSINLNNVEKEITINPSSNIKQGQSVMIEVKTKDILKSPYFIFKEKKINLYSQNDGLYRGILGIDALEKTGAYTINLKDGSGNLNDEKKITISSGNFPIQNIRVTGKNQGLTATQYELNKVQKAKTALTDKAYWSDAPFNSPTTGCIISSYGLTRYYNGKPSGNYHKGVDIKAPMSREIRTITGGKVLIGEQFRLHGGTVAIDHGQGLTSIYIHMSKISVKPGDIVKQGQKIGEVGSTGFATGPHLHWGLYVNGTAVNPMSLWIKSVPKC